MPSLPKNQKGFTLIEILIAITIFAIGLLAIAGLQVSAINSNTGSNLRTATTAMAQGVMEQIMALDGNNSALQVAGIHTDIINIDPNNVDADNNNWTSTLQGSGSFTANWTVAVNNPVQNISRITVSVQEDGGRTITLIGFKRYF